jgi:hypothetical protein
MKVFLSCSFRQDDRKTVLWFHRLLTECGFEVVWAERPEVGSIPGKLYPMIDACEAAVGIFTRRFKIEGREAWTPPPTVIQELAYASRGGKTLLGFIEEGIPRETLGLLTLEAIEIPSFERDRLEGRRERFKEYIDSLKAVRKVSANYKFLQYAKSATIYKNEYGVLRYRCAVQVLSDTFETIRHSFSGAETARKGWTVPPLQEIKGNSITSRWSLQPFFAFRVVNAPFKAEDVRVRQLPSSSEKGIDFQLKFPSIKLLSSFTYEWAWGSPGLFPATKEDLLPGRREVDLDYAKSSFQATAEVEAFAFCLSFEEPLTFEEAPALRIYDAGGNLIPYGVPFEVTKSAIFTAFIAKISALEIPGGLVVARWRPS